MNKKPGGFVDACGTMKTFPHRANNETAHNIHAQSKSHIKVTELKPGM
jgi:hypothetical protein